MAERVCRFEMLRHSPSGFEQLCINAANERVQRHFNQVAALLLLPSAPFQAFPPLFRASPRTPPLPPTPAPPSRA